MASYHPSPNLPSTLPSLLPPSPPPSTCAQPPPQHQPVAVVTHIQVDPYLQNIDAKLCSILDTVYSTTQLPQEFMHHNMQGPLPLSYCPARSTMTTTTPQSMLPAAIASTTHDVVPQIVLPMAIARTPQEAKPARRPRGRPRRDAASNTTTTITHVISDHRQQQLELPLNKSNIEERDARDNGEEEVKYASTAALGVRFVPKPEEMIWYLEKKYQGHKLPVDFIKEVNAYQDPTKIIDDCGECVDGFWYVFSPRNRRYLHGGRPARSAGDNAYWKSNTKVDDIEVDGHVVGTMSELTYESSRHPGREKTGWKMKEFVIRPKQKKPNPAPADAPMLLDEWVICQIHFKDRAKKETTNKSKDDEQQHEGASKTDQNGNITANGCLNADLSDQIDAQNIGGN